MIIITRKKISYRKINDRIFNTCFLFFPLVEIKTLIYIKTKENLSDFIKTRSIDEDQIEYRLSDRPKKNIVMLNYFFVR